MPLSVALALRIAKSKASAGGNWIRDGIYMLEIRRLLCQHNRKKQTMFICEFRVVTAEAVAELDAAGKPVVPNAPGSTCSYSCNLDTNESADGNVKAIVLAIVGLSEDQLTYEEATFDATIPVEPGQRPNPPNIVPVHIGAPMSEEHAALEIVRTMQDLVDESQPMRGALLADTTFRKIIQKGPNAGKPFVGHNWGHVEQTDAEIAARRAALDKAGL